MDRLAAAPPDTPVINIADENLRGGFVQVPRPVLRAKGLSMRAKAVYTLLLDYAWKDGRCFPGQERLAEDLDTSVDTIHRALLELRAYQLIDWKRRGHMRPNDYCVLPLNQCPHLVFEEPVIPQCAESQESMNPQCAESIDTKVSLNPQIAEYESAMCGFMNPHGCGVNNTQFTNTQITNSEIDIGLQTKNVKPQKRRKKDAVDAEYQADAEHLFARHKETINRRVIVVPYAEVARARKAGWTLEQLEVVQDHFAADAWWMEHCVHEPAGFMYAKDARIERLYNLVPRKEANNGHSAQSSSSRSHQRGRQNNRSVASLELAADFGD